MGPSDLVIVDCYIKMAIDDGGVVVNLPVTRRIAIVRIPHWTDGRNWSDTNFGLLAVSKKYRF